MTHAELMADSAARYNTKREIALARADLERQIAFLDSIHTGCGSCQHYGGRGIGCKLAGGQEPPDDVLPVGCDSWLWDQIPF